jgi:lysophospholipase L1-like esterase
MIVAVVSGVGYSLRPLVAAAEPAPRYVALGDSVAAGAGLPLGSTPGDALCGRAAEAYPQMVARQKGLAVQNLACSGAKVDEGIYGTQKVQDTSIAPQLDAAFANGKPDIISMTIGANDVRWSQFIRDCYTWHCGSAWDEVRAGAYLLDLRWELYVALYQIWQRSDGHPPQVLITGYYDPFDGQTCAGLPTIDAREVAWLGGKAAALNKAIESTVQSVGFAQFVAVDFAGHGLCAADSWLQGLADPAPTHPTQAGQAALAAAVAAHVRD